MNNLKKLYKRRRFQPVIIQHAVWLYHRFNLSQRDIEHLLTERGIEVSYESIRLWCNKFRPKYSRRLRRTHQGFGDTLFISGRTIQPTRVRERDMRRFKSSQQAQRFLSVHAAVYSLFNLGRHMVSADYYRSLRKRAFGTCSEAVEV